MINSKVNVSNIVIIFVLYLKYFGSIFLWFFFLGWKIIKKYIVNCFLIFSFRILLTGSMSCVLFKMIKKKKRERETAFGLKPAYSPHCHSAWMCPVIVMSSLLTFREVGIFQPSLLCISCPSPLKLINTFWEDTLRFLKYFCLNQVLLWKFSNVYFPNTIISIESTCYPKLQ